jgi:glyoxylase-like metal-dependent hydrolase (beta-lactamase superfamily II)
MTNLFATTHDLEERKQSLNEIAPNVYAYTTQGDPNSGVIIGEKDVMVIEAQATPLMVQDLLNKIRKITDKPIKYLVLTHYHAVKVLGSSEFNASEIIMSEKTLEMVNERGAQDWESEINRYPRLFKGHEDIKGLTYPSITFNNKLTINLGNKVVNIMHLGEGHTNGDTVVWLENEKVLFAGDIVENGATPYCGDAQIGKWINTLDVVKSFKPNCLVPGRGEALLSPNQCIKAISDTQAFITTLYNEVNKCVIKGDSLRECYKHIMTVMQPNFGNWVIFEHCMCFNVTRAYEELSGVTHPSIWTKKRDEEMWKKLNG